MYIQLLDAGTSNSWMHQSLQPHSRQHESLESGAQLLTNWTGHEQVFQLNFKP